jgi:hypothetical protein
MSATASSGWLLVALIATACGGLKVEPVAPAPAAAKGMRAYVAEPKMIATDSNCSQNNYGSMKVMGTVLRQQVAAAMVRAGYDVTEDATQPVDFVVELDGTELQCGEAEGVFMKGSARLVARGHGKMIAQAATPPEYESVPTFGGADLANLVNSWGAATGPFLVNRLEQSNDLVAYASTPRAPAPAVPGAPTTAASATASVAQAPSAGLIAAAPQPGAYAFIVGIATYRDVPAATGARSDAEHFAQVARQTLGLTDEHVHVALDDHATKSDVLEGLKWIKANVTAGGRVYFYYSGHGAPSAASSTYLLPYDGNPKDVEGTAIAMSDVMSALGGTKAKDVLAIIDSCFSGAGGRSVLPPGARPLIRVREAQPVAQMAMFTASQGDEISGMAPGENAGVFTKYVTQGLGTGEADMNGDGQVSLQELSDYVSPRVTRDSKKDSREQHPSMVVGSGVGSASSFIVEYGLATK